MQLFQSYHLKPKNILGTTKKGKNKQQKQKKKVLQFVASSPPAAPSGAPSELVMSSFGAFSSRAIVA